MNSLNSILMEGNLTADAEIKTTPKGIKVAEFTIASNRYYLKGEDTQKEVSFFAVEAWHSLASKELTKGRGVRVVGRLKQDRWVDTEGKPQARVKIVAEHIDYRPEPVRLTEENANA